MDMFKNAVFGDMFLTRDGYPAIFIEENMLGKVTYITKPKGIIYSERTVNSSGFCFYGDNVEDSSDIVGQIKHECKYQGCAVNDNKRMCKLCGKEVLIGRCNTRCGCYTNNIYDDLV